MDGPDHQFALEPEELSLMTNQIGGIELALGSEICQISSIESEAYEKARRSIFSRNRIYKGQVIKRQDIKIVRSGNKKPGVPPRLIDEIVGSRSKVDIEPESPIVMDMLYFD
jgi:N-acetylneuraminate synthase